MLHSPLRVGDLGEAGGMALGESAASEHLDLLEDTLSEIPRITSAAGANYRRGFIGVQSSFVAGYLVIKALSGPAAGNVHDSEDRC